MSDKKEQKAFLLRLPKGMLDAYNRWAQDELRSLNGQLEYVLRKALVDSGRGSASEKEGRTKSSAILNKK